MSHIHRVIGEEIASKGVISFARFMELALYCPNIGYYERADLSPGRQGDFYTSVSVGSLFGELLAFQFDEWLEAVPPGGRQIMEAGAHDGRLAMDILGWLQTNRPKLFAASEYWILEPSARRQEIQKKTLGNLAETARWFDSWNALPGSGINGVIFSNELLDAMPVHRLGWDAGRKRWFEWGVELTDGEFAWVRMPEEAEFKVQGLKFKAEEVPALPKELLELLPDGFTTEVCPAAVDWWRRAADTLKAGKLLTIDYGLSAEEFFLAGRNEGTLRAYYRHHANHELLARPGEQDLTAHVN
ncbi:MAG TPA: SAM-dependent methyltransferase, partial [Verrucomicrobiae bacterium]|nr:SAM-dependent methyltransferase [Verrucomicrobiae bacterium]